MARYLSLSATQRFYDLLGSRLDTQAFYEDRALNILIKNGNFETAQNVMEFGCGTGRFAARLLRDVLPCKARYHGCDLSPKMVALSRERLGQFGPRVSIWQSGETFDLTPGQPPFDRICSTFVLELFAPERIREFLTVAAQALTPGGLLCLSNLTTGQDLVSGFVSKTWEGLARLSPALVGGCHPARLDLLLSEEQWHIHHHWLGSSWGIPLEVTIAARTDPANTNELETR